MSPRLKSASSAGLKTDYKEYDDLGRLTRIERNGGAIEYKYWEFGTPAKQSTYLQYEKHSKNGNAIQYNYYYKPDGNLDKVIKQHYTGVNLSAAETTEYIYDTLRQLKEEKITRANGAVEIYPVTYDSQGNILSKGGAVYKYEDAADRLTALVKGGVTRYFDYDRLGNPTRYKTTAAGSNMTWTRGRMLSQYVVGGKTMSYGYDVQGIRTFKKSVSGTAESIVTYHNLGGMLRGEDRYIGSQSISLRYLYDASGLCGIRKFDASNPDGKIYAIVSDVFGNIREIWDGTTLQARYEYDAWGGHKIYSSTGTLMYDSATGSTASGYESNIGLLNPIRYRSYYYDTETQLYYLQTRYYDPELGRFVNADDVSYLDPKKIGGLNLFAYCGNDPVMRIDPLGTWDWKIFFGVAAIVVGVTTPIPILPKAGASIALVVAGIIAFIIPSQDDNYGRNNNQDTYLEDIVSESQLDLNYWKPQDYKDSVYHQFGTVKGRRNKKYLSADGKYELVFDYLGNRVYSANNYGTYNYGPGKGADHLFKDVIPYLIWGNSPDDTTTFWDRLFAPLTYSEE